MSKWIKEDAVIVDYIGGGYFDIDYESFENAPRIDLVPCEKCRYYGDPEHKIYENCVKWKKSNGILIPTKPNDFCSYGKRREESDE